MIRPRGPSNPKTSPVTTAYHGAKDVLGGLPETERERALFEALQTALEAVSEQKIEREKLDEKVEDLEEHVDELKSAQEERLEEAFEDAPEPEVNLAKAKSVLRDRRESEPVCFGTTHYRRSADADAQLLRDREATDLLEQLIEEVEGWRKLKEDA
jgi:hypothetical protein